jgi:hypothetical protein
LICGIKGMEIWKTKLVLRVWLTVVVLLLLGTTVWWVAACFTLPHEVAVHRRHLWALFRINYEDHLVDLVFTILILLSWLRARQMFYGASLIYLAHAAGESLTALSDAHFQILSVDEMPPLVRYYLVVHGVIGALLFLGLAGIRRRAAEGRFTTVANPIVVVLAMALYLGDTSGAWHHLYARVLDLPWLSTVEKKFPQILAADACQLLIYTFLYTSALWLTRPATDSPSNERPEAQRHEAVSRAP